MDFPISNPRKDAFISGWSSHSLPFSPDDFYWDPTAGAWKEYKPGPYVISDPGLASPDLSRFPSNDVIYQRVEDSWAALRKSRPNAIFDARAKEWRLVSKASSPTTPAPGDDLAERTRLAKKELDELDRQLQQGILNQDEWERRRQAVRRKYRLE
jgi:hypothetical protein